MATRNPTGSSRPAPAPARAKGRGAAAEPEVCPKCHGAGFMLTDRGAAPCACRREADLMRSWRMARIPKKFLGKTIDSFEAKTAPQKQIVQAARGFVQAFAGMDADSPAKGMWLRGKEGTGKTHIAVATLKEVIGRGHSGLYWNVPELFLELRRLMAEKAEMTEADLFDEALRTDLLVLDDLGAERTSDYVLDRLYVMINGRYQNDLATIITTNRTPDELRAQIGPRIVSRLCEMTAELIFPDGDYRRMNMR